MRIAVNFFWGGEVGVMIGVKQSLLLTLSTTAGENRDVVYYTVNNVFNPDTTRVFHKVQMQILVMLYNFDLTYAYSLSRKRNWPEGIIIFLSG